MRPDRSLHDSRMLVRAYVRGEGENYGVAEALAERTRFEHFGVHFTPVTLKFCAAESWRR